MKKDIFRLPKRVEDNEELTAIQKSINKACNLIENANASLLVKVDSNSFTRKDLEELLASLSDLIHSTSMSLTDMYFNHSDKQIQLINQNYSL
jgi:actin-related protein